jgi:hypothetical protein
MLINKMGQFSPAVRWSDLFIFLSTAIQTNRQAEGKILVIYSFGSFPERDSITRNVCQNMLKQIDSKLFQTFCASVQQCDFL